MLLPSEIIELIFYCNKTRNKSTRLIPENMYSCGYLINKRFCKFFRQIQLKRTLVCDKEFIMKDMYFSRVQLYAWVVELSIRYYKEPSRDYYVNFPFNMLINCTTLKLYRQDDFKLKDYKYLTKKSFPSLSRLDTNLGCIEDYYLVKDFELDELVVGVDTLHRLPTDLDFKINAKVTLRCGITIQRHYNRLVQIYPCCVAISANVDTESIDLRIFKKLTKVTLGTNSTSCSVILPPYLNYLQMKFNFCKVIDIQLPVKVKNTFFIFSHNSDHTIIDTAYKIMRESSHYNIYYCIFDEQNIKKHLTIIISNYIQYKYLTYNTNSDLGKFKSCIDGVYVMIKNKGPFRVKFNDLPPKLIDFIENSFTSHF